MGFYVPDFDRWIEREREELEAEYVPIGYDDYNEEGLLRVLWDEKEKKYWLNNLRQEFENECENVIDFVLKYCEECKYLTNDKTGAYEGIIILVDSAQGEEKGYILSREDKGEMFYEIDVVGKEYYCTEMPIEQKINKMIFDFFKFCFDNNIHCDYLGGLGERL
jgi:hypothetical protein